MTLLRKYPIHVILFGIYPVLALLSSNIHEVDLRVSLRAILVSGAASLLLFSLCWLVLRNAGKAGLITSVILVLFFSYGHVYMALRQLDGTGTMFFARHRVLVVVFALILILVAWRVIRNNDTQVPTASFNLIGSVLILAAILPIIFHEISLQKQVDNRGSQVEKPLTPVKPLPEMPDIYYIILDSYTRADALQEDFELDTTEFLDQMEELGFYVVACGRSNYAFTEVSMASAFNMDYLPDLDPAIQPGNTDILPATALIKNNLLRRQLKSAGYEIVAFDTGYEWNQWKDADLFLSPTNNPFLNASIQPFERMLIDSTLLRIVADFKPQWLEGNKGTRRHSTIIERTLFTLNMLDELPEQKSPRFIYAHINVPHVPFVFQADGRVHTDVNYYNGERDYPSSEEYFIKGYREQIQFLNNQMPKIAGEIIRRSKVPPVIIIQGDHGVQDDINLKVLNLIYLPGGEDQLYPSLTPVNTFRIVLNTLFDAKYPILEDHSYFSKKSAPFDFVEVMDSGDCVPDVK